MALQTFKHDIYGEFRVIVMQRTPWFMAIDVCNNTGLQKRDATKVPKANQRMYKVTDGKRKYTTLFLNRAGVDKLLDYTTNFDKAGFKDWVKTSVMRDVELPRRSWSRCSNNKGCVPLPPDGVETDIRLLRDDNYGEVRSITVDGERWFVGRDITTKLFMQPTASLIGQYVKEADRRKSGEPVNSDEGAYVFPKTFGGNGREYDVNWVNENGLRALINASHYSTRIGIFNWLLNGEYVPVKQPEAEDTGKDGVMDAMEIQTFSNEQFGEIRSTLINGEPWFVAADVCKALDIDSTQTRRLDNDEKGLCSIQTLGGKQEVNIINEYGLYSLIMGSRKPEAHAFKRWVTHEVLPSIRKHGGYIANQENMTAEQFAEAADRTRDNILSEKERLRLQLFSGDDYKIAMAHKSLVEMETRPLKDKIVEDKPKVVWAETAAKSEHNIYMNDMAKTLKTDYSVKIGRNRLFELLRKMEILMKDNVPYQSYIDLGYFVVREHVTNNNFFGFTTLVTPKGQQWLANNVPIWLEQTQIIRI